MPIRDAQKKEDVLDRLLETKRRGQRLSLRLRLMKRPQDAAKVDRAVRRLTREIDRLLGRAMEEWLGSASAVSASIKSVNRKLQGRITAIKRKIDVVENVVEAVGLVDDAVRIAAALMGP